MAKSRPKPYGLQASEWEPPSEMLRIAKERTQDILGVWGERLRWGWREGSVTIQSLAESCYMQGVNDSIDAITRPDALIQLQRLDKPKPRNYPA